MEAKCAILVGQKQAGRAGYETKPSSRPRAGPARRTPQGRGRRHPAGLFAGRRRGRVGAAGLWLRGCVRPDGGGASSGPAAPAAGEWRAAWISYIELQGMDYTSAEAFRAGAEAMMDNCAALGLNTVIVQVRPFGGRHLPQRPVSLEPYLHRDAGGLPRL